MIWIALALLGLTVAIVGVNTRQGIWNFSRFSRGVVLSLYVSFLLPMWSLSFATEALGRERAAQNLIWLLSRPIPRPAIFFGKYLAVLPWCITLNLGGFALICLAAGSTGGRALEVYWPAILAATIAYAALFHMLGAVLQRPAVLALLYTFFIETIMGNIPGHLKRLSISFYTRCLMLERAEEFGEAIQQPATFIPVAGETAWLILLGVSVIFLAVGAVLFSRGEHFDSV